MDCSQFTHSSLAALHRDCCRWRSEVIFRVILLQDHDDTQNCADFMPKSLHARCHVTSSKNFARQTSEQWWLESWVIKHLYLHNCNCTNTKKLFKMLLSLLKRPFSVDDLRHCSLLYSRHFAFFSRTGSYAQAFLRGISKMFWPKNLWNIHLKTGWTIGVHFFFVLITDVNLVPWV